MNMLARMIHQYWRRCSPNRAILVVIRSSLLFPTVNTIKSAHLVVLC